MHPLRSGQFRGQKSLGPLKISLEMAHYVVCPQKKIISRIFKISGALIVILTIQITLLLKIRIFELFVSLGLISKMFSSVCIEFI
jgi:hypothetical protein